MLVNFLGVLSILIPPFCALAFNGTFNPSILRDLYNFCEHAGKWKEIPYTQSFSYLCTKPSLCISCSPAQVLLASKPASK
jgi:hypothetical protein